MDNLYDIYRIKDRFTLPQAIRLLFGVESLTPEDLPAITAICEGLVDAAIAGELPFKGTFTSDIQWMAPTIPAQVRGRDIDFSVSKLKEKIHTVIEDPTRWGRTWFDYINWPEATFAKADLIAFCERRGIRLAFLEPAAPPAPPGESPTTQPAPTETPQERRKRLLEWAKEELSLRGKAGLFERLAKRECLSRSRVTKILDSLPEGKEFHKKLSRP